MNLSVKNIAAIALLVIVLIYAGLKGMVYYKTKNALDNASAQMRIFASLRYDSISSSLLDHSVTINKVTILPVGFEDGVKIDAVTLQTDSLARLLSGPGRGGDFPRQMNVSLNGLKIDLYGAMIDKLERALAQLDSVIQDTLQTACGNKLYLGPADYRDMGYDILDSNLRISYQFADDGINLAIDASTRDVAAVSMEMKMSGPSRASAMAMASNPPQLEQVKVTYTDLNYTQRSNQYCTRLGEYQSVNDYIDALINQNDAAYALQWGFVPGPGLKQAYRDFLTSPGTITISMRPPRGFNQNTAGLYKPEDLPGALNLEVMVNDKPVTDLSFSFTPGDSQQSAETVATIRERLQNFKAVLQDKPPKPVAKPQPKEKGPAPRFHRVAQSQLKPLIGKQIRVYTLNNQVRRGVLTNVSDKTIYVTQQVHRGEFTMNIDRNNVKKIEVYYAR
ncbi:MAG: hypothetical protein PVJ63_08805 [Thioalkalispiraceae bacterium]|jgi:hypothetical protein